MRKLTITTAAAMAAIAGFAVATGAQAAEKLRFAYAVQVHQANMMILPEYAKKHGVDLELVPLRRYADIQLALMTGQVDAASMGYVNVGLMEEKNFRDYRVIAGAFTGGQNLTLATGVKATKWKDLEGLTLGTAPNSYSELIFKASATLGGADVSKIKTVSFTAGGPAMQAALKNGEIKGFVSWEPNNADAAIAKTGYYSSLDIAANPTKGINGAVMVSSKYLAAKRAAVVGLIKALIEATDALNANREEYVKVAMQGTGSSEAVVRMSIPHGNLDYKLYQKEGIALLKMIAQAKITKDDTSGAIPKQYDYSVLEEATGKTKQQLGGE